MKLVKKVYDRSKKFVSDHRVGLAYTAGFATMLVLNHRAVVNWNNFLDEHGLTDEYYQLDEEEVLNEEA